MDEKRTVPWAAGAAPPLSLFDGGDWAAVLAVLQAGGVTHLIHGLMLYQLGGGEASAEAAGGACATLCDAARAIAAGVSGGDGALTVLCIRSMPPPSEPGPRLTYATAGGALAQGLCKTLSREHAAVGSSAVVDTPSGVSVGQLVAVAISEILGGSTLDEEVEYREGRGAPSSALWGAAVTPALDRHVKRFVSVGQSLRAQAVTSVEGDEAASPASAAAASPLPPVLLAPSLASERIAVVISGGLGAIGVAVVQLLLTEAENVRVILLGKRPPAEADKQLQSLGWAGAGSRVSYAQVDLGSSEMAYTALLEALRSNLAAGGAAGGEVGGASAASPLSLAAVLHLAGSYERAPLESLSAAALHAAVRAKTTGAVHLHRACAALGAKPAFLLFGSTASIFGGAGLGGYSASNAFLEWFASWQRQLGGVRSRALVWTAWGEGISRRDK